MTFLFIVYNACVLSLFGGYLARYKPDEFNYVITSLMFNCVYIYSKIQLASIKFHQKLENTYFMMTITNFYNGVSTKSGDDESEINKIEFVKNGEVVEKIKGCSISKLNDYLSEKEDYDFAIYDLVGGEDAVVNKKILQFGEVIQDSYEVSDIRFFLIELTHGEKKMLINLEGLYYNFYVVGNVFSKEFIKYYFKNIYNTPEELCDVECLMVNLVDHNISVHEIIFKDNTQNIILNKENYILNNKCLTNDN